MESHKHLVEGVMRQVEEMKETPASQIDPSQVDDKINCLKNSLKNCDTDIKDAKRRISAAKGPRKARQSAGQDAADSDSDGSVSV